MSRPVRYSEIWMTWLVIGTLLLLLPLPSVRADSIDYDAPENVRKFADALWEQADYLRAAGEYQRYLFYEPNSTADLLPRISRCYQLGGKPELAIRYLDAISSQRHDEAVIAAARRALGETYFYLGQYQASLRVLTQTGIPRDFETQQWIGLNYLMMKQWQRAMQHFETLGKQPLPVERKESIQRYQSFADEGMRLPLKSSLVGGVLSALFPGAGRLYVGRINDALMTVLVLGLAGWQSYDGFAENGTSSVKGWLFGTLGSVFYLGNVYGSVMAAKGYNRETEAAFLFSIPLPLTTPTPVFH